MRDLAFQFGEKVGFFNQMNSAEVLKHPVTLGGLGGAAAGAVSGLISPGEYEDADGNVKRRSRAGSALRRALMFGAGGAGAGAAYDYFSGPKNPTPESPPRRFYGRGTMADPAFKNPFLYSQPTKMEQNMDEHFFNLRMRELLNGVTPALESPTRMLERM